MVHFRTQNRGWNFKNSFILNHKSKPYEILTHNSIIGLIYSVKTVRQGAYPLERNNSITMVAQTNF